MTVGDLSDRLQKICPFPLEIKIHENRSMYAQAHLRKNQTVCLSLHRLFLYSSTPVLQALIQFALYQDLSAKIIIRKMAHLYFTKIEPPAPNFKLANAKGHFFDLQNIFDHVNSQFFEGKIQVPITWFKAPRYRCFHRVTFGSFDRTIPLIRINQLLDQTEVPLPFVEYIVYHEMLHVECEAIVDKRGHLRVHTPEFRRREALHPYFKVAKKMQKEMIQSFKTGNFHGWT